MGGGDSAPLVGDSEITGEASDHEAPSQEAPDHEASDHETSEHEASSSTTTSDSPILRALAYHGWEPDRNETLPPRIETRNSYPVPSPFADAKAWTLQTKNRYERLTDPRREPQLRTLWTHFSEHAAALRRSVPEGSTEPFLGALREGKGKANEESADVGGLRPVLVACEAENDVFRLDLQTIDAHPSPCPGTKAHLKGKFLEIRRFVHRESQARGYFLVNHDIDSVVVNTIHGKAIRPPCIFGPLPAFAAITIGSTLPIFWWRSLAAIDDSEAVTADRKRKRDSYESVDLDFDIDAAKDVFTSKEVDYMLDDIFHTFRTTMCSCSATPSEPPRKARLATKSKAAKKAKKPSVEQPQKADEHASTSVSTAKPDQISTTWRERLESGLQRQRRRKAEVEMKHQGKKTVFADIKTLERMGHYDIVNAIASVWEALRRKNIYYAFGHDSVYQTSEGQSSAASDGRLDGQDMLLPGERGFIMPLVLPGKTIKSTAHYVLAVTRLLEDGIQDPWVDIEIFDSCVEYVPQEDVQSGARRVVQNSDWLASVGVPNDRPFRENIGWPEFPRQEGVDTCGFNVILNAWAVMLEIPLYPSRAGRRTVDGYWSSEEFLDQGREMLNLALAGCMDSETIQAFMNTHGYSAEQSVNDAEEAVRHITTVRMNTERFGQILKNENKLRAWRENKSQISSDMDAKISQIIDMLVEEVKDEQQIVEALILEDGDIERAVARIFEANENPLTPSPVRSAGSGKK